MTREYVRILWPAEVRASDLEHGRLLYERTSKKDNDEQLRRPAAELASASATSLGAGHPGSANYFLYLLYLKQKRLWGVKAIAKFFGRRPVNAQNEV